MREAKGIRENRGTERKGVGYVGRGEEKETERSRE